MELWYIPKGVSLPIHRHPNQSIDLMPLIMDNTCVFCRRSSKEYNEFLQYLLKINGYPYIVDFITISSGKTQRVKGKRFKWFTTPDGYYHWFVNRTKGILFLNKTTWLNVDPELMTSPSKNYINLENEL